MPCARELPALRALFAGSTSLKWFGLAASVAEISGLGQSGDAAFRWRAFLGAGEFLLVRCISNAQAPLLDRIGTGCGCFSCW